MLFIIWLCKSEQQRSCHEDLTTTAFVLSSVGQSRSFCLFLCPCALGIGRTWTCTTLGQAVAWLLDVAKIDDAYVSFTCRSLEGSTEYRSRRLALAT